MFRFCQYFCDFHFTYSIWKIWMIHNVVSRVVDTLLRFVIYTKLSLCYFWRHWIFYFYKVVNLKSIIGKDSITSPPDLNQRNQTEPNQVKLYTQCYVHTNNIIFFCIMSSHHSSPFSSTSSTFYLFSMLSSYTIQGFVIKITRISKWMPTTTTKTTTRKTL